MSAGSVLWLGQTVVWGDNLAKIVELEAPGPYGHKGVRVLPSGTSAWMGPWWVEYRDLERT